MRRTELYLKTSQHVKAKIPGDVRPYILSTFKYELSFFFVLQIEAVGFMIINLSSLSRDLDVRPATGEIYAYSIEPFDYARFNGKPEVLQNYNGFLFVCLLLFFACLCSVRDF